MIHRSITVIIGAAFLALSACAPAADQPSAASGQAPGQANATGSATAPIDSGTALSGTLAFADIKLQKPSVPVLLSLQDIIKLELDATLTRAA